MSRVREKSRGREREANLLRSGESDLGLDPRTQDHDLSCRQVLNRLRHPDYQNSVLAFYFSFFWHLGCFGYFCNVNAAFSSLLSLYRLSFFFGFVFLMWVDCGVINCGG